ncbi:MAG: hypothetical protein WAM39_22970 [Bryobacteraceae bacterium]
MEPDQIDATIWERAKQSALSPEQLTIYITTALDQQDGAPV